MQLPAIQGVIDRRVLVNFRVDADVLAHVVPPPFRPRTVRGFGVAGICLIRLKDMRPCGVPLPCGLGSENAAHRIAVEWDDLKSAVVRQGVFIPRRDTDSRLSTLLGGTLFPGEHHHARFHVQESADHIDVAMTSDDGRVDVRVAGHVAVELPASSMFATLDEASAFFEAGSLGYSTTRDAGRYDGLELACEGWSVAPLAVEHVASSFFADDAIFPGGSVTFDNALLMRGIRHTWHSREDLCCTEPLSREAVT